MGMTGKGTVYRGHEGIREFFGDVVEALSVFDAEYSEIRELGDRGSSLSAAFERVARRAGPSSNRLLAPWSILRPARRFVFWTFLDDKEALEAAGLVE